MEGLLCNIILATAQTYHASTFPSGNEYNIKLLEYYVS